MLKCGKLMDVTEEKVTIKPILTSIYDGDKRVEEKREILSFSIEGKQESTDITFSFALNCKTEELLSITSPTRIDLKPYMNEGETILFINGQAILDLDTEMKILRWSKDKFVISIKFESSIKADKDMDIFSGIMEFDFDIRYYNK